MSDPIRLNIEGMNVLFPVPSSGNVTFDFYIPPGAAAYNLALYAANGQLIHKETANAQPGVNRVVYNWNKLAAGVYYMQVTAGTYTYKKRLLIAR
jgi:Secretion system C-terminal sorting domain